VAEARRVFIRRQPALDPSHLIFIDETWAKFALKSANVVEEIDVELMEKNSPFEISHFSVAGTAGIITSANLTIFFTKTASTNEIQSSVRRSVTGICPSCGEGWVVEKLKIAGKSSVSIRCSSCSNSFMLDGKKYSAMPQIEKS
jgi:hypothetical protein